MGSNDFFKGVWHGFWSTSTGMSTVASKSLRLEGRKNVIFK